MPSLTVDILYTLTTLPSGEWNAVSGTENPFTRHEFLHALETRNCTTAQQGWQPHHLAFRNTSGELVALLPTYLKNHSYGEYVFDWGWADAYRRHGLDYYPKLLSAIPFTPSVGPRLLRAQPLDEDGDRALFQQTVDALTRNTTELGASSWHLLFPEESTFNGLMATGHVLSRAGCQFRWHNHDYRSFDDFLAALVSRKRKMIRKERKAVLEQGIRFRHLPGPDIEERDLDAFYVFYQATYLKRGQQPYLTREFFQQLRETMPEQMHLVLALHDGAPVAAALFFLNDHTLFGRYWGCLAEYDRLHFETCYYQGIDLCIERRLKEFDAGAQGEHKILRGFEPVITHSCHWIAHPAFRAAIDEFVTAEAREINAYAQEAAELLPYRREARAME